MSRGSETNGTSAQFRTTLRCDLTEVRPTVERIRKFLIKAGCPESQALECELALVEACTNAIQHVSPANSGESTIIEAMAANGEVELRVTDHTPGFDWPKQAALPMASSEKGRGIFLIQSLMTSTAYIRGEHGNGNVLILRKTFRSV